MQSLLLVSYLQPHKYKDYQHVVPQPDLGTYFHGFFEIIIQKTMHKESLENIKNQSAEMTLNDPPQNEIMCSTSLPAVVV